MKAAKCFSPVFEVVPGTKHIFSEDHLIDTAWLFAYSILWNHQAFSHTEKQEAKFYISQYILPAKNPRKAFLNFCQRVVLARQHIELLNTDFLSLPSLWLDSENEEGYAITREWLEGIKTLRFSLPSYQIGLRAIAEAVLEFSEEPTSKNFKYWRSYFIEHGEPVLLHLFGVYASNQQFNIR
jgi:hypothetical protein